MTTSLTFHKHLNGPLLQNTMRRYVHSQLTLRSMNIHLIGQTLRNRQTLSNLTIHMYEWILQKCYFPIRRGHIEGHHPLIFPTVVLRLLHHHFPEGVCGAHQGGPHGLYVAEGAEPCWQQEHQEGLLQEIHGVTWEGHFGDRRSLEYAGK